MGLMRRLIKEMVTQVQLKKQFIRLSWSRKVWFVFVWELFCMFGHPWCSYRDDIVGHNSGPPRPTPCACAAWPVCSVASFCMFAMLFDCPRNGKWSPLMTACHTGRNQEAWLKVDLGWRVTRWSAWTCSKVGSSISTCVSYPSALDGH